MLYVRLYINVEKGLLYAVFSVPILHTVITIAWFIASNVDLYVHAFGYSLYNIDELLEILIFLFMQLLVRVCVHVPAHLCICLYTYIVSILW